jgi:hypothetical protein
MAAGPQRSEIGRPHLNAHIAPVERAYIARAKVIEAQVDALMEDPGEAADHAILACCLATMAAEFRALAEELHHW